MLLRRTLVKSLKVGYCYSLSNLFFTQFVCDSALQGTSRDALNMVDMVVILSLEGSVRSWSTTGIIQCGWRYLAMHAAALHAAQDSYVQTHDLSNLSVMSECMH